MTEPKTELERAREIIKMTFEKSIRAQTEQSAVGAIKATREQMYDYFRVAGLMPATGRKPKPQAE